MPKRSYTLTFKQKAVQKVMQATGVINTGVEFNQLNNSFQIFLVRRLFEGGAHYTTFILGQRLFGGNFIRGRLFEEIRY